MPFLLPLLIGAAGGFYLADGTEAIARVARWGVIGGAGYLAAKHFKVL